MRRRSTERGMSGGASGGASGFRRMRVLAGILLLASPLGAQSVGSQPITVSAVKGESWLTHLNRSFDETSMGKTGRLGPSAEARGETETDGASRAQGLPSPAAFPNSFTNRKSGNQAAERGSGAVVALAGSDLYRLSCRGCHGETGAGAPPEIGSVLNPVRATSPALVLERTRSLGMTMSAGQAAEMARQSQDALLERIHKGGQDMPPMSHLSEMEIGSLVVYLKQLASVPGTSEREVKVQETRARVGELIVKSTCHVCHSAEGANPTPEQMAAGAIPPLTTLTARVDEAGLVRKVTAGAPVVMGAPPAPCRGRMPVFYYLSAEEAADVYLYLKQYPPEDETGDGIVLASATMITPTGGEIPFAPPEQRSANQNGPRQGIANQNTRRRGAPNEAKIFASAKTPNQASLAGMYGIWLLLSVGVLAMIGVGWTITVREFQRLEMENERRRAEVRARFLAQFAPVIVDPMAMLGARAAHESAYRRSRESA